MWGKKLLMVHTCAMVFTAKVFSISASEQSRKKRPETTPALLTRMSGARPSTVNSRAAFSISDLQLTSQAKQSIWMDAESADPLRDASFSSLIPSRSTSQPTTCAPHCARATQTSRPMPMAHPVTSATRPRRLPLLCKLGGCDDGVTPIPIPDPSPAKGCEGMAAARRRGGVASVQPWRTEGKAAVPALLPPLVPPVPRSQAHGIAHGGCGHLKVLG
mmetsp:Transcript_11134/g.28172  ORF Transcript_11134/g.28172 Transcript_11134/m.28172 type:complete len:217 (+) Transcript_11134:97-747(+)